MKKKGSWCFCIHEDSPSHNGGKNIKFRENWKACKEQRWVGDEWVIIEGIVFWNGACKDDVAGLKDKIWQWNKEALDDVEVSSAVADHQIHPVDHWVIHEVSVKHVVSEDVVQGGAERWENIKSIAKHSVFEGFGIKFFLSEETFDEGVRHPEISMTLQEDENIETDSKERLQVGGVEVIMAERKADDQ